MSKPSTEASPNGRRTSSDDDDEFESESEHAHGSETGEAGAGPGGPNMAHILAAQVVASTGDTKPPSV